MECPICGHPEMLHDTRNIPYTYKGKTTTIANVEADYCDACGEHITDANESRRVMAQILDFNKQVNAQIADPEKIHAVRVKLNLTQQQAGELFGGGVNAFSRYETGKAQPPLALIQLFKILDKHPNLITEL